MRYLFIVQGEGRGHMTQSISLRNKLVNSGHEVTSVIIGKSARREIPSFFQEKIHSPVHPLDSPNFVVDKRNKKINIPKSIFINLFFIRRYFKSLRKIHQIVKIDNPDIIVNFYDLLGGFYSLLYKPRASYYCIGHQYLSFHPDFPFPQGQRLDKFLFKINTRITAFRADKLFALSFRELPNIPQKKLFVLPPLLRKSVLQLKPVNEGFIHGYILNEGYAKDVINWHKKNADVKAHFFWDNKDAKEITRVHKNLVFHRINDEKFLDYMSRCAGYASTAGFESICEAMYLGKPIMMVPTDGHYEQKCNALDAVISRAGISDSKFDLTILTDYIPNHKTNNLRFKLWADRADNIFMSHLTPDHPCATKNRNLFHCNYLPNQSNI